MGNKKLDFLKSPKKTCRTCEYEWYLRAEIKRGKGKKGVGRGRILKVILEEPKNCPNTKCKSPYWSKPYVLGV